MMVGMMMMMMMMMTSQGAFLRGAYVRISSAEFGEHAGVQSAVSGSSVAPAKSFSVQSFEQVVVGCGGRMCHVMGWYY